MTSGATSGAVMSFTGQDQAESALEQQQQQGGTDDGQSNSMTVKCDSNNDDEFFSDELDFRSAHLSSFMEAVRSAAQARNRTSSFLGVSVMSAARVAAQVGVPMQATFSAGGTAR